MDNEERVNSKISEELDPEAEKITMIHPEIQDIIGHPEAFNTQIEQIPIITPVLNPLHLQGCDFCPPERRKCITCDTKTIELLQGCKHPIPSFLAAGGPRKDLAFVPQQVNVGIVVAGGTAPGTNTVIHWIVKRHVQSYGLTTGNIYGFIGGFRGLGQKGAVNIVPLKLEDTQVWHDQAGCAIGMSRHREDIPTMVNTLEELKIDILYVIGGDGTLEAAYKIGQEVKKRDRRIVVAAIPKTIDNDIVWCWKTFGFETGVDEASKFIQCFHDNIRTHGRIGMIVVYGGESGFLAANAGLSSGVADAVLIPEEHVKLDTLYDYTERCIARKSPLLSDHALIVIAEGIAAEDPFWDPVCLELYHRKVIKKKKIPVPEEGLYEEVRSAFVSTLYDAFKRRFGSTIHTPVVTEPRSLVNSVRPSARDIRYCQRLAFNAVDNALAGYTSFMSSYWLTEYVLVPLAMVAGRKKRIPLNGSFWANVRSTTGQPKW